MKLFLFRVFQYALYPLLITIVLGTCMIAIMNHWSYESIYGLMTLFLVTTLIILEYIFPLKEDWKMTLKSFIRDIKYIAVDIPTIAGAKFLFATFAIYYSQHHIGLFSQSPIIIGTICYLLVFEFFQYWYHRLSHTLRGRVGKFLWNIHLTHHLPDKVYVIVHAVFNPIQAFITVILVQLPLILLGVPPEVVLIGTLLIDLQSMISHFNMDLRVGFLNYIFIGSETHRIHHTGDTIYAKNFGNTLAIWDLVFGTFSYTPGVFPKKLGVPDPSVYPPSNSMLEVISYPFHGK